MCLRVCAGRGRGRKGARALRPSFGAARHEAAVRDALGAAWRSFVPVEGAHLAFGVGARAAVAKLRRACGRAGRIRVQAGWSGARNNDAPYGQNWKAPKSSSFLVRPSLLHWLHNGLPGFPHRAHVVWLGAGKEADRNVFFSLHALPSPAIASDSSHKGFVLG